MFAVEWTHLARTWRPESIFTYCSTFAQMAASLQAKNDWNLASFVELAKGDTGGTREWETRIWGLWLANRDWGGNLPTVTWTPPCCINVRTRSIDNKLWVAVCLSGQGSRQTNLFMTMLLLCYLTRSVPPATERREGCQVCVRVSVLPTHVMTYTNICSNNQPMATTRTDKRDTSIKSDKKFDNKSKCEPKARRVEVFLKRPSSSVDAVAQFGPR